MDIGRIASDLAWVPGGAAAAALIAESMDQHAEMEEVDRVNMSGSSLNGNAAASMEQIEGPQCVLGALDSVCDV